MSDSIKQAVLSVIKEVAATHDIELPKLKDSHELVDDLGFSSLQVAALIANLEEELGVDPFEDADVSITDLRTIGDLNQVYVECLA